MLDSDGGRCYNEIRLFLRLDSKDPGFRVKCMLYGGTLHDSMIGTEECVDVTLDSDVDSIEANEIMVSKRLTKRDNQLNKRESNKSKMENVGNRGFGPGRAVRLSCQPDDLCTREALSLARFVSAQVSGVVVSDVV